MLFATYPSPAGPLLIAVHNASVVYCNWLSANCTPKLSRILKTAGKSSSPGDRDLIIEARKQINEYFSGRRIKFNLPLQLNGTPFQVKIWQALEQIPFADTISYKQLAENCGLPSASRAVARACGANPLAIILPCHRVVASNGQHGGYTGGLEKKIYLLNHEKTMASL